MTSAFEASASYGQIAVFRMGSPRFPFWTQRHVDQGFAMTSDAASFLLPEHDGSIWVECETHAGFPVLPRGTIRAIEVPFPVKEGRIGFSSIDGDLPLPIEPEVNALRFVLLPGRAVDGCWMTFVVLLQFIRSATSRAAILVRDAEVTASELIVTADALG